MVTPAPLGPEAAEVWDVILDSGNQVRVAGLGGVIGLDFNAVFTLAQARGADLRLLAEVLPAVELFIIFAWSKPS